MMGTKTRTFAPLPDDVSLEDLASAKTTSIAAWKRLSTSRS
jgi:hypothetical protein